MTQTYGIRLRALRYQVVLLEDGEKPVPLWPTHETQREAEEDIARRVRRDQDLTSVHRGSRA